MATDYSVVEPFPLFVDSNGPSNPHYFSSKATIFSLLNSKPPSTSSLLFQPRLPAAASNYLRLRYYQYEVTFGLYMLTYREKCIFNMILFSICAALMYGICFSLQPLLVWSLCRLVWYMNGSLDGVQDICTEGVMGSGCT